MIHIVFETHSTTTDNEHGIATGWLPGVLSEAGRTQARRLGDRHRNSVAAVYASDLARAQQTVSIAFGGSPLPVVLDARLRECDYGSLNGRPTAEVHAHRLAHISTPYPGGESFEDVARRMAAFLHDLANTHRVPQPPSSESATRVLIVGHSATRFALEHLLRRRPLTEVVGTPAPWQPGWAYTLGDTSTDRGRH